MSWNDVDRLISEQKFEAASEAVTAIRARATAEGDAANWTRALVEETKLRMALHGYETAVRFLKEQPWPEDAVSQAVLELYYADAVATYARVYSWEINQRERVETTGELDLKAWDLEQIVGAANASYLTLWSNRAEWGSEPLGELARYIQQNNYPPRIRSTLRDAVTYLWVELLADSSLWSPAESNQVFQLDAAALIAGDPRASSSVDLADPGVHPLVKIGVLLDDLENWHATDRRPEAALEARLERLRRLHGALTTDDDRLAIIANLEEVQAVVRPQPRMVVDGAGGAGRVRPGAARLRRSDPCTGNRVGGPRPPPGERRRPALQPHRRRHRTAGLQPRRDGGGRRRQAFAPGLSQEPEDSLLPRLELRFT